MQADEFQAARPEAELVVTADLDFFAFVGLVIEAHAIRQSRTEAVRYFALVLAVTGHEQVDIGDHAIQRFV